MSSDFESEESNKEDSKLIEFEGKQDFSEPKNDGSGETEVPEFSFQFKFPSYEEFSKSKRIFDDFVSMEAGASAGSASKYEVISGKSFSGFIDEPEVGRFQINEASRDLNEESLLDKDLKPVDFDEEEAVHEETAENSSGQVCREDETEKGGAILEDKGKDFDKVRIHTERDSSSVDSDLESISLNYLHSVMSGLVDSFGDGFLSDGDFGGEFEADNSIDINGGNMDEMSDLEAEMESSNFLSEKDFYEEKGKSMNEKYVVKNENFNQRHERKSSSGMDTEDAKKMESLWEHQELIEQLKMELKKVRATGLPTILEESESPKIMEDLKPWKIDEKFQRGDGMGDLHKFYRSYRERMRKFDILNYQKMYALGFLQLKDPLQSIPSTKPTVSEITSLLSQSFSISKGKNHENEPTMKFVKELQSDLEVVYVGQMCLSWEILYWQYEKALDLWESDPRGIRRFTEVAGEFQQFQVLMQRFIEDEPFEGPRVQNYIKNRCVLRNLLQVPVIREDSSKNRNKARKIERGEYDITSDMLVEIMEESIRIFWRFVRNDKDCTKPILIGRKGPLAELQDPADSQLFMEIRKDLQKKERKLKDLLRSGNCILRKLQKCREDDSSDQVLYFFSQVDMRLVSRVLHLSRITTDQLIWCRNKLSKISFVNRKIRVEPTFLLFPC